MLARAEPAAPEADTPDQAEVRTAARARVSVWRALQFAAVHVACLAAFFVKFRWSYVVLCAAMYYARMFFVTAGYHRYFSHRSFKTSRAFQFVLAFLGCSALQKGPLWWSAHHRHHHLYSDTDKDPHSPRTNSFWWSHIGWILSSAHEVVDSQVV